MIDYVIYNDEGRIVQTGQMLESMIELQSDATAGRHAIIGSGTFDKHWVQEGAIVERPEFSLSVSSNTVRADGSDVATIGGVPAGAEVSIVGPLTMTGMSDGRDIVLTFAIPGTYDVGIQSFPYQDVKVSIHAV